MSGERVVAYKLLGFVRESDSAPRAVGCHVYLHFVVEDELGRPAAVLTMPEREDDQVFYRSRFAADPVLVAARCKDEARYEEVDERLGEIHVNLDTDAVTQDGSGVYVSDVSDPKIKRETLAGIRKPRSFLRPIKRNLPR